MTSASRGFTWGKGSAICTTNTGHNNTVKDCLMIYLIPLIPVVLITYLMLTSNRGRPGIDHVDPRVGPWGYEEKRYWNS